jgi:hypothetical protein
VVAYLKTWRRWCSEKRGGDVSVCSAVSLSMRHVVMRGLSSSSFLTPAWGRAELMLRFGLFLSPHTRVN